MFEGTIGSLQVDTTMDNQLHTDKDSSDSQAYLIKARGSGLSEQTLQVLRTELLYTNRNCSRRSKSPESQARTRGHKEKEKANHLSNT